MLHSLFYNAISMPNEQMHGGKGIFLRLTQTATVSNYDITVSKSCKNASSNSNPPKISGKTD
jgi:hypothetical protein